MPPSSQTAPSGLRRKKVARKLSPVQTPSDTDSDNASGPNNDGESEATHMVFFNFLTHATCLILQTRTRMAIKDGQVMVGAQTF